MSIRMNTDDIIHQITDEGASRPLLHPAQQSVLWLVGISFYLLIFLFFDGFRSDVMDKLNSIEFLGELFMLFIIGISATFSAFCLSRPDDFQMPWIKYLPFPLLLIWAVYVFSNAGEHLQLNNLINSVALVEIHCPIHIVGFSAIPAIVIFFLVRMGAAIRYYWAGIMSTLSVTAFAYLFMRLVESNDNPAHLLIWHALPILIMCVIGMLIGKKTLRW